MGQRNIAIGCYQFSKDSLRKQPWNYVSKMAKELQSYGYDVSIITDGGDKIYVQEDINGLKVHRIPKIRLSYEDVIKSILEKEKIDLLFWSIGPSSSYFQSLFKGFKLPVIGLYFDSLYTFGEVMRAQLYLRRSVLFRFFRDAFVPRYTIKRLINSEIMRGVVTLSQRTMRRLIGIGCNPEKVWLVRPGYDYQVPEENRQKKTKKRNTIFLYLGGPQEIRGLDFLIRSFTKSLRYNSDLKLIILLRSDKLSDSARIYAMCKKLKIIANVAVISGIQSGEVVQQYLRDCDVVVLPFLLVPSEIPISILEAMAMGRPVISTEVDGIPELIVNRGIIVKPGDEKMLKDAILLLAEKPTYTENLRKDCLSFMKRYPTWHDSVEKLVEKVENVLSVL